MARKNELCLDQLANAAGWGYLHGFICLRTTRPAHIRTDLFRVGSCLALIELFDLLINGIGL